MYIPKCLYVLYPFCSICFYVHDWSMTKRSYWLFLSSKSRSCRQSGQMGAHFHAHNFDYPQRRRCKRERDSRTELGQLHRHLYGLEPKTFMVLSHLRLGFGAIKIYAWIGDINKFDFESLASMVWIQRHLGLELCTRVIVALDIYALSLIHL
jgi:hypothetical protein